MSLLNPLVIKDLCFTHNSINLLDGLSLTIEPSEIVTLIGSSGCGKTTLLRLALGLETADSREIIVLGEHLPHARRHIAYMMQEDLLLPWRTARENALLPLEIQGKTSFCIEELFSELGLEGVDHLFPHQLSGGMRQRVALARTLIEKKPLLLLDEPFSSLDVVLREQLYSTLRSVRDQYGTTILMVTHDFHDALMLSDRILHLSGGKISKEWVINDQTRQNTHCYGALLREIRDALFQLSPV